MAGPELTEEQKGQQFEAACKAKPLKDQLPSLRSIQGFPIGTDEDILALSDPPYYTACPNPYINDFIAAFGEPYDPATDDYERTPFVSDVSEGKSNPVYNAYSYHTKVPHKAIMPFINHYTEEEDLIYDGFCGTGMTGVAAQLLNRYTILSDISPISAFISKNFNSDLDLQNFEFNCNTILNEIENECKWMYEVYHVDGVTKGLINFVVWSDVFICPFCMNDYIFWEVGVEKSTGKVNKNYQCPSCQATISKNISKRKEENIFDSAIGRNIVKTKQLPVLVNYSINGKRYEREVDNSDIDLIKKIESSEIPYWYPKDLILGKGDQWGDTWRAGYHLGITNVHHFYTKRTLWILAALRDKCKNNAELLWFTSQLINLSKMNRYRPNVSFPYNPLSGTLYIGSQIVESNVFSAYRNKLKRLVSAFNELKRKNLSIINVSSAENSLQPNCSIDYIFTDPPFGDNLLYSELNFIAESWIKITTNNLNEAIINKSQGKQIQEYKKLMASSFMEMNRILKPNRWMTVIFHNSRADVWNAIQDAISKSGFIIAQVSILDKQQGSFKQVTAPGAVEKDLIINAYKPRFQFEDIFLKRAGAGLEREFVAEHLSHLPKEPNVERTEQMLFSKMLAHYIQRGYEIRLNSHQFYDLLKNHFKHIDGYWFLDNETAQYEEWKKAHGLQAIETIAKGQQTLFITDERSFLIWLYNFLSTPKTFGDIYTASRNILSSLSASKDQIPEPKQLLDINFIFEDGKYRRPTTDDEREDVESRRERELQKSFENILELSLKGAKIIKDVRKEALLYGFTKAYQERRFADIMTIGNILDKKILENNSELNDFVEIAMLKMGEEL